MSSGWGRFMRMLKGEPVFQPGDEPTDKEQPHVELRPDPEVLVSGQKPLPRPGPKELPMVTIIRCLSTVQGEGFECELRIANRSSQRIRLMSIEMLGLRDELGSYIEPGFEREEVLRFNDRPNNTSDNLVKLRFTTPDSDQFYTVHTMVFDQEPDRTFTVRQINFQPPVRDI